jgi:hypothetical protein
MTGPNVSREERERRIRLWASALRSGRYQQATGALRKDDGFCCLGVACEVYRLETGRGEWLPRGDGDMGAPFLIDDTDALDDVAMPHLVAEWILGDPDAYDPDVDTGEGNATLSHLNDEGITFAEIAWYVEEQILPAYTEPLAGGGQP